jgi:2,3-bisphosphoglycerate-independent phosphoglycerate mutase
VPISLIVLDGWGHAPDAPANAISLAAPRQMRLLQGNGPRALLAASGRAVGLPDGVMGNSEVGHLTIGAGRVILQDLVRISDACADGSIGERPAARGAFDAVRRSGGRLHFMGLCSDAGVHSHLDHVKALVLAASRAGVARIAVHPFTDGRDTPPSSAAGYVRDVEDFLDRVPGASIGVVCGRYHAMDRDNRWERTERAYRALVEGAAEVAPSAHLAVARSHAAGVTDEFIAPTAVDRSALVRDGDAIMFFNFRADRGRQLTRAFMEEGFAEFSAPRPKLASFVTMTQYHASFGLPVLFEPNEPTRMLGETFSEAGWPQLRLAETEKYAHVTYFLNGGREQPFPGEERVLVPSPKVATYDLQPAMAATQLAAHASSWIGRGGARLMVLNFANADMVGHSGILPATIEACRVVDECVGQVADATRRAGGALVVTADHGNAECMVDERGGPHTAHTLNPVPLAVLDARAPGDGRLALRPTGGLCDVAPTLLELAGLVPPSIMTGQSLILR